MSRPLLGTSSSEIGIDRDDREPIQSQIARQIRALVLSGRLKPQARLPSTRALSEELNVARATVEGSGELMFREPDVSAAQLRKNVTSPGGTTKSMPFRIGLS